MGAQQRSPERPFLTKFEKKVTPEDASRTCKKKVGKGMGKRTLILSKTVIIAESGCNFMKIDTGAYAPILDRFWGAGGRGFLLRKAPGSYYIVSLIQWVPNGRPKSKEK